VLLFAALRKYGRNNFPRGTSGLVKRVIYFRENVMYFLPKILPYHSFENWLRLNLEDFLKSKYNSSTLLKGLALSYAFFRRIKRWPNRYPLDCGIVGYVTVHSLSRIPLKKVKQYLWRWRQSVALKRWHVPKRIDDVVF
jgi:hypothetical protein